MTEENAGNGAVEGRMWPGRNVYAPDREPAPWPGGKRLAVYVAVGVEDYVLGRGLTEDVLPDVPMPDLVNASWRAYGLRVGGPRLLDRLHRLAVPITILLNTAVYDSAGPLIEQARRLGAELVAHGEFNSDSLGSMSRSEEKTYLQKVAGRMEREEGRPPLGWSSPWLTHSRHTLDLLTECGYRYLLGLRFDDQPVWLETGHGPLLAIPYSVEVNDSSAMIGRNVSAKEFGDRIVDEFREQLAASADTPLVMSIILHSFISGVPFRLHQVARAIEQLTEQSEAVWFARPCDIYAHLSGLAAH
jgi:peptidoglycan/xylan/chitin deacetylase (PgdA/CDA1 family)